jgi:hypothetical protein
MTTVSDGAPVRGQTPVMLYLYVPAGTEAGMSLPMPGFPDITTIGGGAMNGHPATYLGEIETLVIPGPEGMRDHSTCSVRFCNTTRNGLTDTVAAPAVSHENLIKTFLTAG